MKFIKKTKQGNLHYILSDGRIGAIYPDTGYVRVSHSMKGFADDERSQYYLKRQRQRNIDAVRNGTTGALKMYQINPVEKRDEYHEITIPLYYNFFDTQRQYQNEWRKAYYKFKATRRVLYPNDTVTLVLLLQKFENKNCK